MKLRILSAAVLAATTATAQTAFYEIQAAGTNDLVGMRLVGTLTGSDYTMTLVPSGGVTVPVGAMQLVGIGDDVVVDTATVGGTLGMFIGSNGWMAAGSGNSNQWAPSAALFLGNPSAGVYNWTDLQPNAVGSGGVYYSEAGTVATATYDGVYGWGTTDLNTFSIEYDTATGNFAIDFAAVGAMNPEDLLTGFALAGPNADPGQTDISAAAPFTIFTAGFTATVTNEGTGCGSAAGYASFYEVSSAGMQDLVGTKLTGTWNGTGYDITSAPGAGFGVPVGATELVGLGDDVVEDLAAFGGTLGLYAGSNCWLANGPGNSNQWAPSAALALANPSAGVYAWTDLQPNAVGSGQVWYDEVGTVGRLTYDGVYGWGTTDANTVQLTYDTASGDFTIEISSIGAGNPQDQLVGFSPSGASNDPGSMDISAAAPFAVQAADAQDLLLTAVGTPIQGAAPVNFDVTTSNIPAGTLSHLAILGLAAPALPLDGIGMPGCFLNAGADFLNLEIGVGASGSHTWTALVIPDTGSAGVLSGFAFNVQAAIFGTSVNSFLGLGALTSNGLTCVIGDV